MYQHTIVNWWTFSSLSNYWNAFSEQCEVGEMRDHHPGVPTYRHTHAHNPEAQRETGLEIYFWKKSNTEVNSQEKTKSGSPYHLDIFYKKVKHVLI